MTKNSEASWSKEQAIAELHTSLEGLSDEEARSRLASHGPNTFKNKSKKTLLSLLLEQLRSSLIYLLVIATLLSFLLKDYGDGTVILVILLINTGLGFYQEYRSENAIAQLQKLVSREILVKRDGKETLVAEQHLVPGDLVILREGDIVPADIKLVQVDDLRVDESQLTGESVPVTKSRDGELSLAYAGSTIEEGEGEGFVYATATDTKLGKIAHLSIETKRVTQYEKELSSFSTFLVRVTLLTLFTVFVFKILIVHDRSQLGTLGLFIVALSITVVPEAMPVIATVTLSRGAMRLAKRHVIAKTLTAVEDLGNINILCSDKTGTLTENKQTVTKLISDDPKLFQKLAVASLETLDEKRKKFQSSFDQAFLKYVPEDIQSEAQSFKRLMELPFDPAARRRRTIFSDGKITYLVSEGSVETLLELTHDTNKAKYLKIIAEDGKIGLRHLGIAYKKVKFTSADEFDIVKHETDMVFAGFVALEDPLRPTAKHTITLAEKLGITIKILSGDSREVTEYVAREVGLITQHQIVYTGDEIEAMTDERLGQVAKTNHAFAKLNPEQKYRIIGILKKHHYVVGYQGDGINDAPALKLADVAIAVSNATDVAQESADILLLRSDLGVIVNGIQYGRSIFTNINKYIRYTMIGNFGNFFALSALYLISNSTLPLLPIQLVMTGLLTDIPLVTIATDNVETKDLLTPNKFNTHSLMFLSMFLGSITGLFETLFYAIVRDRPTTTAQTSLFLFLTLSQLVIILSVRNKEHFWKAARLSTAMIAAFAGVIFVTIAMVYIGYTKHLFSFGSVSLATFGIIIGMTLVYLYLLDVMKIWFYQSKIGTNIQ